MANKKIDVLEDVSGEPVKSFFVEMLTRDISLEDSILDLLDNCVDGIMRGGSSTTKTPYNGYWADIQFDGSSFQILDNCGGIPAKLRPYAFRLGRVSDDDLENKPTVGYYGIGMKRAIFKIGRDSVVQTMNKGEQFEVQFTPEWIKDELNWDIPARITNDHWEEDGTVVIVGDLRPEVAEQFGRRKEDFEKLLRRKIATNYAFIIGKGFEIVVNGETVNPRTTELKFETSSSNKLLRPYIYEAEIDGVEIFVAVGFIGPIPSEAELDQEAVSPRYSSEIAGWTVVCNDRAVVYANRDELTGWGESGVPKYHTQFVSIAGIVEFKSQDPSKLPTNTTKRGLDANSRLYLQVKNKMREGMRMFTAFTNQWKSGELREEAKRMIDRTPSKSFQELKKESKKLNMRSLPRGDGKQYKPPLPRPKSSTQIKRISFSRKTSDIELLGEHYFGENEVTASEIGEKCFDVALSEVQE